MRKLLVFLVILAGCGQQGERGDYIKTTSTDVMIGYEKCQNIVTEYQYAANWRISCPSDRRRSGLVLIP
jgi:hypothetical protein